MAASTSMPTADLGDDLRLHIVMLSPSHLRAAFRGMHAGLMGSKTATPLRQVGVIHALVVAAAS